MNPKFLKLFNDTVTTHLDKLYKEGSEVPVRDGIPRFSPDLSYSSGNFSMLRDKHATLQLDSVNGTTDRRDTLLTRTGWAPDFFKGKLILECGCGAGPDTEVLLSLGATVVAVDLAGVDIAAANLGHQDNLQLIQASIAALPLRESSFDIVFCHRVIMHTPDPAAVMNHILKFVRPNGGAFVHSYSRDFLQMARWKYALRPITKRMDPERLYRGIERASSILYPVTHQLNRNRYTRRIAWHLVPYINHSHKAKFANFSEAQLRSLAVHETFDALSPSYDQPMRATQMHSIAAKHLQTPFEVVDLSAATVMRTLS